MKLRQYFWNAIHVHETIRRAVLNAYHTHIIIKLNVFYGAW